MLIVDYETDAPILLEARQSAPNVTLTLESEQAVDVAGPTEQRVRLIFWAEEGDFDAFERALGGDPTVTNQRRLAGSDRRRLYSVRLSAAGMAWSAYHAWVDLDASLIGGRTTERGWSIRMRFPDREAIVRFSAFYDERDLDFTVTGLFEEELVRGGHQRPRLTEKQREALEMAWERGYFKVPREVDLVGLAEELGVSDTGVSQRLRRGLDTVLSFQFGRDRQRPGQ